MRVHAAHFRLNEGAPASASLDLTLAAPSGSTTVSGIRIDIMTLARNDFGAISYPDSSRELFDEDGATAMTALLMPHLHLLTRGRVVPLDVVLRFAPDNP